MEDNLFEEEQGVPHHKMRKKKNGLVVAFDEDARAEFLTGFRKRKNERRRIAKQEIAEKERRQRREAKKQKKLEMLRAYGIDVLKVHDIAPDPEEGQVASAATYDTTDTAITVTTAPLRTRAEEAPTGEDGEDPEELEEEEDADEDGVEPVAGGEASEEAKTVPQQERPKDWKKARSGRKPVGKKLAWSKSKGKKIHKHNKKAAKLSRAAHRN